MKTNKKLVGLAMFDFLKGVGILLVLIRHSIYGLNISTDSPIWQLLYSFIMPLFFLTSGYWLKNIRFCEGLKTSARQLLKPYLIVIACIDIVGLIHRAVQGNIEEWLNLFLRQSLLVMSGEYSRIGFMWFIFALFMSWVFFYALIQIKNEKLRTVISIMICCVGTLLLKYRLPFQLAQAMIAQLFVYAGYLIKKKKYLEKPKPAIIIAAMTAFWIGGSLFCFRDHLCDLSMYEFGNGIPSVLCSLCGTILIIEAGIRINAIDNIVIEKIGQLGRYTMWILCIHSFEATVIPWRYLFQFIPQNSPAGCAAQFTLRCLFIFIICFIFKKIGGRKNVRKNY